MNYPYGGGVQPFYAPGGGGGGGGAVSSIIAGPGISVDQATGDVTITNTAVVPTQMTAANSTGNTTITPSARNVIDIITITGVARTSVFIMDTTGRVDGDLAELRFNQPATAAIIEEIRNATSGGTLLYTYTTDGSGTDNLVVKLYFKTGAWHPFLNVAPVV